MGSGHFNQCPDVLMKKALSIIFGLAALLVLSQQTVSCTFRELEGELPKLNVYVFLDKPVYTKVTEGEIAAISDAEKEIHTLQIWVFKHADGALIAYLSPSPNDLENGTEEHYSTYIKKQYAQEAAGGGLSVDVYVLANAASAGLSFNGDTPRATLDAAEISGSYFAPSSFTTASDIETNGLPMSCVSKTLSMTGSDLNFEIPKVTLKRAVSKVRFVLCQSGEMVNGVLQPSENFTLNGITLGVSPDGIPETEFVFNDSSNGWRVGNSYVAAFSIPLPAGLTVPLNQNPRSFEFSTQSAQEYENLVNQNVVAGNLSQIGPFYMRESDKALKGTVSYTVGNESRTTDFQMDAPGDFARNHSWTVYAYFSDGKLFINPVIADWTLKSDIQYTTKIGTGLQAVETYKRYDTDGDYTSWADSYVLVSYGYKDSDENAVSNPGENDLPTYSRRILLYTEAPGTDLQLNLDNPNFKLVLYNRATQKYDHSLAGGQSFVIIGSEYNGPETNYETRQGVALTYFYVVPVSEMPSTATLEQRTCHVYLSTVSSAIGSVKVPFNSESLPGYSGASDEIWFYYTGADMYPDMGIVVDVNTD